jgi:Flp pilus assembly protein protease CpaA
MNFVAAWKSIGLLSGTNLMVAILLATCAFLGLCIVFYVGIRAVHDNWAVNRDRRLRRKARRERRHAHRATLVQH